MCMICYIPNTTQILLTIIDQPTLLIQYVRRRSSISHQLLHNINLFQRHRMVFISSYACIQASDDLLCTLQWLHVPTYILGVDTRSHHLIRWISRHQKSSLSSGIKHWGTVRDFGTENARRTRRSGFVRGRKVWPTSAYAKFGCYEWVLSHISPLRGE